MAELDDILKGRITILKAEREKALAAIERATQQSGTDAVVSADKVAAFAKLMRDVLASSDTPARKAYLRSILSAVEVDDNKIRIIGSEDVLHAAVAGTTRPCEIVQFSGPKWRARKDSNSVMEKELLASDRGRQIATSNECRNR